MNLENLGKVIYFSVANEENAFVFYSADSWCACMFVLGVSWSHNVLSDAFASYFCLYKCVFVCYLISCGVPVLVLPVWEHSFLRVFITVWCLALRKYQHCLLQTTQNHPYSKYHRNHLFVSQDLTTWLLYFEPDEFHPLDTWSQFKGSGVPTVKTSFFYIE